MATAADLLDDLKSRFDADQSKLLRSLDGAHKLAVARSRSYRGRVTVSAVTGASEYPMPTTVLATRYVMVGGYVWVHADETDIPALIAGDETVVGTGGVFASGVNGSGVEQIQLYPPPTDTTETVEVVGALRAPTLTVNGVAGATVTSGLLVPDEFSDALVEGASPAWYRRDGRPDLAGDAQQFFDSRVEELRRQVRRRFDTGPRRVRIQWP